MEILDVHKQNMLFDLIEQGAHEPALERLRGDHHISEDELNKSLISACQHGYKFFVQMLVARGANVNFRNTNRNTPLLISVQNCFTDIVKFLLRNKADVNASNSVGDSALILSIHSSGSTEITENLLKQTGITIDPQNQDGYTAIMKAAEVKDIDTLKILLDEYFKVDGKDILAPHYECVDEHGTQEYTLKSVPNDDSKWATLNKTENSKKENIYQIAERCGIGGVLQLLQEHESTKISPLELALRADDIKSFHIFLDCDFIYAANKKKYLDGALKHIFQTCSKLDNITFSENETAMIKALLEHGADVNTTWLDPIILDKTPKFDIEKAGNNSIERLSNIYFPFQRSLYFGKQIRPIHIAAKSGCYQVLELLLSFKADVNRHDFQNSPLHIALSHGHTECAKLLIQHGARLDFNQGLELAVSQQEPKYVRFLMDNFKKEIMEHLKRTSNIDKIFITSVRMNNLEIIGQILDLGANINGSVKCPLAESRNGEVTKFLIDRGANVKHVKCTRQTKCHSPLIKILTERDTKDNSVVEVIQVLLENGASGNDKCSDGTTALMLAARNEGSTSVLQLLLDHGAELSEVDKKGNTALVHAVENNSVQNVSFLLQISIDRKELLSLQNGEGLTALMYATRMGNLIITNGLIDQGADINIKDRSGNTALLYILFKSYQHEGEIIKSLIQGGCDVNWQNNDGLSPLMLAAKKCCKDTICVLLDSGAEINAVSKIDDTKTAVTHLLYSSNWDEYFSCLEFLLDRGASSSYIEATTFHKIIVAGHIQIVPKLIRCGLGPVCFITGNISFSDLVISFKSSRVSHSINRLAHKMSSYSPLCTALCVGNSDLARFFVGNLFLTHSDVSLLGHNRLLRQYLKRKNYKECLDILNEMSTQPMTLFNLSFVAVLTAVGASPGREIRVDKLPVPQIIKDKLLFKKQDVALAVTGADITNVDAGISDIDGMMRVHFMRDVNDYYDVTYYENQSDSEDYYNRQHVDYYNNDDEDYYNRRHVDDYNNVYFDDYGNAYFDDSD